MRGIKKIVVFGNQQIAIDCISILKKRHDVELLAVIGCERPQDKEFGYPSVRQYCFKKRIPFYDPPKLDNDFLGRFKSWRPDLCFSVFYRNIFSRQYLSVPPMGFINTHSSLLPKYRGPIPVVWAMFNNEDEIGVTLHYIDEGIDTGDIIAQVPFKVPQGISGYSLNQKVMQEGVQLFEMQLPLILNGKNKRKKQNHSRASYFGPFNETMKMINWYLPIRQIVTRIQILTRPYKGGVSVISGKEVLFWEARMVKMPKKSLTGPGKIVKVYKDKFVVSGVDGFLMVTDFEILDFSRDEQGEYIKVGNKFNLV